MRQLFDLQATRTKLDEAMELVEHDRFVLGGLRDGMLKVIADSNPPAGRRNKRTRELAPLARRALFERQALTVSSVLEPDEIDQRADWEMGWPALLYAPVGMPKVRPVGLLIVGTRNSYWYEQEAVNYVSALAITLTPCVLALTGPLARLRPDERQAAHLIGEGLSIVEIANGLQMDRRQAERIVSRVLSKLSLRSLRDVGPLLPDTPVTSRGLIL